VKGRVRERGEREGERERCTVPAIKIGQPLSF